MKKGIMYFVLMFFAVLTFAQSEDTFEIVQNKSGGITITGFSEWENIPDVIIPATISGIKVTELGPAAFISIFGPKTNSVTIPNTVVKIDRNFFFYCKFIEIIIPDSVKEIVNNTLPKTLTSITLGNNVNFFSYVTSNYNQSKPFDESFINFYESQGKKKGTYIKEGRIWKLKS
jgi:hypothetical protein